LFSSPKSDPGIQIQKCTSFEAEIQDSKIQWNGYVSFSSSKSEPEIQNIQSVQALKLKSKTQEIQWQRVRGRRWKLLSPMFTDHLTKMNCCSELIAW
jgi:hypothetical protein